MIQVERYVVLKFPNREMAMKRKARHASDPLRGFIRREGDKVINLVELELFPEEQPGKSYSTE